MLHVRLPEGTADGDVMGQACNFFKSVKSLSSKQRPKIAASSFLQLTWKHSWFGGCVLNACSILGPVLTHRHIELDTSKINKTYDLSLVMLMFGRVQGDIICICIYIYHPINNYPFVPSLLHWFNPSFSDTTIGHSWFYIIMYLYPEANIHIPVIIH